MNKKFTKLIAALALLVFMTPSMAGWGQTRSTETFSYGDYTGQGTQSTGSEYTMVKTDVSITNTKFYGNTSYAHFYANGTTTITPKNGITITQIVLTASGTNYNGYQSSGSITASIGSVSGSTSSTTVTWTGSASSYFTISNNKQIRWTSIEVTYTSGGSTTYTVTFDCDGGTGCPEDITGIEEGDDNFTVPSVAPTKEHYGFDGFYIGSDDEMYEPGETYTIESDLELTASWTINKNNVTLNDDNTAAELYAEYGENMMLAEGETVAINYGTELALGAEDLPANHIVVWTVKNTSNVDVTADVLSGTTVTVPDYAIIITGTVTEIPTYTINFIAGSGTCETASISGLEGSSITLPPANPSENCATLGWTFAGWATASVNVTQTAPTLLTGIYTISGDATLYAVYSVTESDGGGTTTFNFGEIASANDWVNGTAYTTVEISPITLTANGGGNNGKYYTSDKSWRMYNGGTVGITSTSGSITAVSSNPSKTFTINNDGSASLSCNTTIQFKSITVTYGSSTTTYNSNPVCQLATLNVTLNNIGANFAEDDWSHEIEFDDWSAQLVVGTKILVSVFELDNCHLVGESPLEVVDGNDSPVEIMFDEEDYSYYFFMPESGATLTATSEALPQSILTVDVDNNVTFEITYGELSAIVELDDDNTAELCEGVEVTVQVTIGQGYVMQSLTAVGSNGQAILLEEVGDNTYTFAMPATGATLSATTDIDFPTNLEYALHSGDLVEGDYVIYYNGYAMKNTVSSSRLSYLEITPNEDVISNPAASIVWHIAPSETEGYWTIYNAAVEKYAAGTGADNKAQLLEQIGTDGKALWETTTNTENGVSTYEFVNKYNSENEKNAYLRNNTTYGWACYNPNNIGGALSLYKKVEYASEMEIGAYNTTTGAGWHFIASPFVGEISHNVNAGAEGTDLYFYDEQNHHWRNYKTEANQSGFDFANGKGYLYANSEDITLQFAGTSIVTSETRAINLSYHATTAGGEENSLAGWNLVGNPFDCNAILDKPCYTISGMAINTEAQTANEYLVGPCEGVMVKATENGETVTFTKAAAGQTPQPNQLQMTVAQQVVTRNGASTGSATVEDNAIVSFNEGNRLEKFAFNADAAKLYIPQNGKEYAIVSAKAQGEMPVNFRATKNGTYTLTINPEGVEMNYLHLIDNMTGANIDLLQTPSYTFNASMNDYESRFKLVFAAGSSTGSEASETFAFFANGELIVSNEGEATLQVVDMTGRILSSQSLNGNGSVQMAAPVGVYVLRLISGNEVKTQKIVVR